MSQSKFTTNQFAGVLHETKNKLVTGQDCSRQVNTLIKNLCFRETGFCYLPLQFLFSSQRRTWTFFERNFLTIKARALSRDASKCFRNKQ